MYKLSNQTKRNIEYITGVPIEKLCDMDVALKKGTVENKGRLRIQSNNPLLAKKRVRTLEYVNEQIDKLTKEG